MAVMITYNNFIMYLWSCVCEEWEVEEMGKEEQKVKKRKKNNSMNRILCVQVALEFISIVIVIGIIIVITINIIVIFYWYVNI